LPCLVTVCGLRSAGRRRPDRSPGLEQRVQAPSRDADGKSPRRSPPHGCPVWPPASVRCGGPWSAAPRGGGRSMGPAAMSFSRQEHPPGRRALSVSVVGRSCAIHSVIEKCCGESIVTA
jgi:hypothetical protein